MVTHELIHQALEELGIDGPYWFQARKDGKIEIWTPYRRRIWEPSGPHDRATAEPARKRPSRARKEEQEQ